jgi:transcriptional regulator with XRE-family HTH domain
MGRKLTRSRPKQGAHLARLRKAAGLSQARLAEIIGETQGNIAFWEVTNKPPRGDVLPKLAKALGVEIADLILHADKPPATQQKPAPPKLRRLFDEVLQLPTRQQNTIIEVLAVFLENFRRNAKAKVNSNINPAAKAKSKTKKTKPKSSNLNSPLR